MRFIFVTTALLAMMSNSEAAAPSVPSDLATGTFRDFTKINSMDPIARLNCDGNIKIRINGRSAIEGIWLSKSVDKALMKEDAGLTLSVKRYMGSKEANGSEDVLITGTATVARLQKIMLNGTCALEGKGIPREGLKDLESHTKGRITLEGFLALKRVFQTKANIIELYWLDTQRLGVESRAGFVRLGGIVERIRVDASAGAQVDMQFLQSNSAWFYADSGAVIRTGTQESVNSYLRGGAQLLSREDPAFANLIQDAPSLFVMGDGVGTSLTEAGAP